jgi:hypothetical protein
MSGAPGSQDPAVQTPYGYLFPCAPAGGTACSPGTTLAPYTAQCQTPVVTSNAQVNPCLGVIRYIFWNANSNYNGLNVNIDKVFSHGFQFQVSYTFSKSLDDDSQTVAGDTFANGINSPWWWLPKAFYGPSDYNVAHTLSINGLYTIPTPKSWGGFKEEALVGWELGGIFTYNSGAPTTPINNGDPLGLGNSGADQFGPLVRIPGCNPVNSNFIGGPAPVYLNQNCFTEPYLPTSAVASLPYGCDGVPNAGQPGFIPAAPSGNTYCLNLSPTNIGRNSITGPKFVNLDFSIHKDFPIHRISEQTNLQFRAEMFNIFNHSNFVPPQPCSGDCNAGLINPDGSYAGVGNLAELASNPREIQFALKLNW